jgi:histidinol-phosphatase
VITLPRFRAEDLQVETKPDSTPVSEADRGAEERIRELLGRARPNDGIIGEELGSEGSATRRWIIDPIDGTKSYVAGRPTWATLIALEEGGELVVGVASAPALGKRWWASRADGAYADGARIHVSDVTAIEDATVGGFDRGWEALGMATQYRALVERAARVAAYGDFYSHIQVAEGGADIAAEPVVNVWDLAALLVIVEEAGGRLTDLEGRRTAAGGNVLTTNGKLHDEALGALRA